MFSRLESKFQTQRYQAEATDTRLGIREHQADGEGRKNNRHEETKASGLSDDDMAVVSVDGLVLFLKSFLQRGQTTPVSPTAPSDRPVHTPEKQALTTSADTTQARAIAAYRQGASHIRKSADKSGALPQSAGEPESGTVLSAEEAREVHKLIGDLKKLEESGISELTIIRAESFLQSLRNAVDNAAITRKYHP